MDKLPVKIRHLGRLVYLGGLIGYFNGGYAHETSEGETLRKILSNYLSQSKSFLRLNPSLLRFIS
jgi:hypothetical protein